VRWLWSVICALAFALHSAGGLVQASEGDPGETSLTPGQFVSSEIEAPVLIEVPVFRLEVPFRTQKDGSRWQSSNCGPAALGMVLDAYGLLGQASDDLRFRSHTYQGTVGARTGTALQHIVQVAHDLGLPTTGLYQQSGQFNAWGMDDIRGQLRLGRPVMALVRLYLLPGHEAAGARWGHYILLTGLTEGGFFYSDPLKPDASEGTARVISATQLERAMYASLRPGQAVAFGGWDLPPLAVWTPSQAAQRSANPLQPICDSGPRALRPYLVAPSLCYA
jgi:hypothetical protein